jgi:hypothetical protein
MRRRRELPRSWPVNRRKCLVYSVARIIVLQNVRLGLLCLCTRASMSWRFADPVSKRGSGTSAEADNHPEGFLSQHDHFGVMCVSSAGLSRPTISIPHLRFTALPSCMACSKYLRVYVSDIDVCPIVKAAGIWSHIGIPDRRPHPASSIAKQITASPGLSSPSQ